MDTYFWINTKFATAKYNGTYNIQLPRRITLTEKHEIGLLEISYSRFIKTMQIESDCLINISYRQEDDILHSNFQIPWKNYQSVNELVETINEFLHDFTDEISLEFDSNLITVNSIGGEITFSKSLAKILALKHTTFSNEKSYSAKHPDLNKYNQFMNVCIDVIEPQFVGNKMLPLLRRVNTVNFGATHVHSIFSLPIYFSILKNDFDVITIRVVNDNNINIVFDESDAISLFLHIRKK